MSGSRAVHPHRLAGNGVAPRTIAGRPAWRKGCNIAARKSSSETKLNSATQRQQSTSSTRDAVHPDAVAALRKSAELLWILEQLQSNAKSTQCCLDDLEGVHTNAESAVALAVSLVDGLHRLQGFLSDTATELLKAANDNRLVEVENRMYPSYCYAAFHLGASFYFNFLCGPGKCADAGVGCQFLSQQSHGLEMRFEIGVDPKRFNIKAIRRSMLIENWRTITQVLSDYPLVRDHLTLGNQLAFEIKRLLQLTGEDSDYRPAINLWRWEFLTYKQFQAFLRDFPEIRMRKPSKNRLLVHVGDFMRCIAKHNKLKDAGMDNEGNISNAVAATFKSRMLQIREKKRLGK